MYKNNFASTNKLVNAIIIDAPEGMLMYHAPARPAKEHIRDIIIEKYIMRT